MTFSDNYTIINYNFIEINENKEEIEVEEVLISDHETYD